jgi:hypothetical protein
VRGLTPDTQYNLHVTAFWETCGAGLALPM